jgi:AraC family transcriptional regulator, regulatory protein of adaptative response / DNA-3-methyladenine glycosylase II
LPGVEEVSTDTYRRALRLPHGEATVDLRPQARWVAATLRLSDVRDLAPAVSRCRRLFDLDADPVAVDGTLGADPAFAAAIRAEPGLRVPRAVDGFEMAVRAVVGQQVSVTSARATLTRMVEAAAGPVPATDHDGKRLVAFPGAATVAELPDSAFAMPSARRETIRALARAVASGELDLEPGADRAEAAARLRQVPGIGAWTAGYIAIRAIGDPDVFLPTDAAVQRGARALGLPDEPAAVDAYAERWRPWRSYAVIRLWRAG